MKKTGIFLLISFVAFISVFATPSKKQLTLLVQDNVSTASTQAILYFDVNLQPYFVYPEDSQIVFDTSLAFPQIYTFTSDGVPCYLNGFGNFTNSVIVPVGINISGGSNYSIGQSQIDNFDAATMILLEDRLLGTFTNLRQHSYTLSISEQGRIDGRFFLHLSFPPQISDVPANCSNENGTINVTEDSTITWSACLVYDSASNLVGSVNSATGNFSFPGLNAGAYSVEFDYGSYAVAKPFYLVGGLINLSISASHIYAAVGQNINFSAVPVNTDVNSYVWNFGDGTIITRVANFPYAYTDTGKYIATFKCGNIYNCRAEDSITMHISYDSTLAIGSISANEVKISNDIREVRITITNTLQSDYSYEIDDLSGQALLKGPVTSSDFIVATNNLATGIYLVSVKNNTGRLTKKIILP